MTGKISNGTIKFRVHTSGGVVDVEATSPDTARKLVKEQHPDVIISKVKQVKGGEA